jgi:hypothetical protein
VSVPIDIPGFLQTVEDNLAQVPGVVFAAILLGGPTALWLLNRFVVVPRTSRYVPGPPHTLWVCPNCRSANEVNQARCYRCGYERESLRDLEIVYSDPELERDAPAPVAEPGIFPGVPVGPGRPVVATNVEVEEDDLDVGVMADDMDDAVPVGPARPVAAPPRRLAVADKPTSRRGTADDTAGAPEELEGTAAGTDRTR